jgi:hypothetical protein
VCLDAVLPLLINAEKNSDLTVVNIKTLKGRFYCTQVLYWVGGGDGEECGKEEECCWPLAVKYMSKTHGWTQKLNREDYGVDNCCVLLAVVKECTLFSKTINTVALT